MPTWGERLPQRHVQIDPELPQAHDLTLNAVATATADALTRPPVLRGATTGTGGFTTPRTTLSVVTCCPCSSRSISEGRDRATPGGPVLPRIAW
jgi:hypothetical protein